MPFSKNACQRLPISPKKAGDEEEDIFDRSVDVQVLRLRRKLEIDPSAPRVIRTGAASAMCSRCQSNRSKNDEKVALRYYGRNRIVYGGNDPVTASCQSLRRLWHCVSHFPQTVAGKPQRFIPPSKG
jgi:Transcriptional regulatory protein, C terminal